jgi:hypothetical protein
MIDQIIVTGCSYSTGMEMQDHLIGHPSKEYRRSAIWQWYRKNNKNTVQGISIEKLDIKSNEAFHHLERQSSWPALLEKETAIPVINLSVIGSSMGRSLVEFSKYCKENKFDKNCIAIHQLPEPGRFYMRFCDHRINILPSNNFFNDLCFNKNYFKKEIKKVKERYRSIIEKDVKNKYIQRHFNRCIERIKKIGSSYNIQSFFILPTNLDIQQNDSILIKNLHDFRNNYKKGRQGHPIDPNFNRDIVDTVLKNIRL